MLHCRVFRDWSTAAEVGRGNSLLVQQYGYANQTSHCTTGSRNSSGVPPHAAATPMPASLLAQNQGFGSEARKETSPLPRKSRLARASVVNPEDANDWLEYTWIEAVLLSVSDLSLCLQVHDVCANSPWHFWDGWSCGSSRGVLLYGREDAGEQANRWMGGLAVWPGDGSGSAGLSNL
jgi:hypothetical protein